MTTRILSFVLVCLSVRIFAQVDAYHTALNTQLQSEYALPEVQDWILPNNESSTLAVSNTYGTTAQNISPAGQPFSMARRFVVTQGNNPWDAGHLYFNTTTLNGGDKCLVLAWLRSPTPGAKLNLFAEDGTTYDKEAFATINLSDEWKMYAIPFSCSKTYTFSALHIGLHLAYANQTVEAGGVACVTYNNLVTLEQLPTLLNNDTYPGIEPDAPWRAEAAASIEQLRKADLEVQVLDPSGNPLPGAHVYLEMRQHDFKFGTAVVSSMFNGGAGQNDTYEQKLLNLDGLGHGFNEVVFENDLKWPAWEQHWNSSQAEIASDVQWLKNHDISIRGHNLIWPGWTYSPPDLEQHQNEPNYLLQRIQNHLNDILNYPGVGQEMRDWDVLNEITGNNDYANALAGAPGFPTGRELYPLVFQQAESLAPQSVMYLNDYVAIEQGDGSPAGLELWKSRIDELRAVGAPLEGIGFQGHFGASPTGIPRVKAIYDDFWNSYGLEAKVTEYDISSLVPPQTQAQYMRDILTISFAHPSLKGFLMWGFWDGAHWLSNAPLFRSDWTLKPSGEAFVDQVFHRWWTNADTLADAVGKAHFRGFKGKYRLLVACGNSSKEQEIVLDGNKSVTVQLPCTVRVREASAEPLFQIAPNRINEELQLFWEEKPDNVLIFNSLGQVFRQDNAPVRVYTGDWPAGMYWVRADFGGVGVVRGFVVFH